MLFRSLASRCFFFLLLLSLFLPVAAVSAGQAAVFVYHRFGDDRYPSTNISTDTFSEQLRLLKEKDYAVLPLAEVAERLRRGRPLPERCVVLTVDDAYASFMTGAMPLLRRFGYPVTLFVNTAAVGTPGYLDWDELRRLTGEGVTIGNHTVSHPYLLSRGSHEDEEQWQQRVRREIAEAQEAIKRELGVAPILFSYPFGEYSPQVVDMVREFPFVAAVGQHSGVAYAGSDIFILPRFPMGGVYGNLGGFEQKAAMKALPVEVIAPETPLVTGENPPTLEVRIGTDGIDLSQLRCFVPGQPEGVITAVGEEAGRFRVQAKYPLQGRRSKYTLTAPAVGTAEWHWFSQLWVFAERPGS